MFRKGERDLLCDIRRRKAWSNKPNNNNNNNNNNAAQSEAPPKNNKDADEDQRSSSTSSSSEYITLVDENKRLKEENGVLNSELSTMKRKCRDLLDLVSMYATAASSEEEEEEEVQRPPPLMLFGVRLEVQEEAERKRKRAEINQTANLFLSQLCK